MRRNILHLGLSLFVFPLACSSSSSSGSTDGGVDTGALVDGAVTDSGASDGADVGDTADASFCVGDTVPSGLKLCKSDADCSIASHTTSCCGSAVLVGVASASKSTFDACEKAWDDHFPKCGCPTAAPTTEDGKTPADPSKAVVHCVDFTTSGGICKTVTP